MWTVTPAARRRSSTGRSRMSTPETSCPISASANAMALMPGPPTPITCTRRRRDRSSGATGASTADAGAAESGVDAAITTGPGYGWTCRGGGDAAAELPINASGSGQGDRFHQLSQGAAAVDPTEVRCLGGEFGELVGLLTQPADGV